MSTAEIYTSSEPFTQVFSTEPNAQSYSAPTDLVAVPSPNGVNGYYDLTMGRYGRVVPNCVMLKFYGQGGNGLTGNFRVYGVRAIQTQNAIPSGWTHTLLAEFAFTVTSGDAGVAGSPVGAADFYASTITETTGNPNVSDAIISPGGTIAGHVMLDTKGCQWLLFVPKCGTASSIGVLVAGV